MKLLHIVIIAVLAILLSHWTLNNILSRRSVSPSTKPTATSTVVNQDNQDNLLDFVRGRLSQLSSQSPKPGNYFSEQHDSDIHDQRTDLSKFFEVQQSVPDTKQLLREITNESGACSGGIDAYGQCLPAAPELTDAQTGHPMRFSFGSDGSATMMPDHWSYQNENVMNGGLIDGVRGFDNDLSDYTVYPSADATKPEGLWTSSYPYTQSFGKW